MANNDNSHALRFYESMVKHNKRTEIEKFSQEYPLSKSANIEKKYDWALQVCDFMSKNYDDETVKEIRMDCACGPECGKAKKIKRIYEKETDIRSEERRVGKEC